MHLATMCVFTAAKENLNREQRGNIMPKKKNLQYIGLTSVRVRTKQNERNEKCLCAQLLALRAFSLPAEGGEVKPDLRAEKAAAASGSAYTGEPAVCTSRKSERRRQFAVTHEEEMLSL